jgi:hypothetical protein
MSDIAEIAEVMARPVEVVDEMALAVQLGQILGRRQVYVELAGRCSAHDAAGIKKLRDTKLYLKLAPNWAEFCPKYLGMSKPSADRVIRWLDDFGPDFFTLTQLTHVSPEDYRERIAPAMAEGVDCQAQRNQNHDRDSGRLRNWRKANRKSFHSSIKGGEAGRGPFADYSIH